MVKVIFYHLLRSKYKVNDMLVESGSVTNIIDQILKAHEKMSLSDFATCVVFNRGKVIHHLQFDREIPDGEELIITHFVGGG